MSKILLKPVSNVDTVYLPVILSKKSNYLLKDILSLYFSAATNDDFLLFISTSLSKK